jgi:hypothetical protein
MGILKVVKMIIPMGDSFVSGEFKGNNVVDDDFPPSEDFQGTDEDEEDFPPTKDFQGTNEDDE